MNCKFCNKDLLLYGVDFYRNAEQHKTYYCDYCSQLSSSFNRVVYTYNVARATLVRIDFLYNGYTIARLDYKSNITVISNYNKDRIYNFLINFTPMNFDSMIYRIKNLQIYS